MPYRLRISFTIAVSSRCGPASVSLSRAATRLRKSLSSVIISTLSLLSTRHQRPSRPLLSCRATGADGLQLGTLKTIKENHIDLAGGFHYHPLSPLRGLCSREASWFDWVVSLVERSRATRIRVDQRPHWQRSICR